MTARHSSSLHLPHTPVMLREMLAALNPQGGGRYVDGTFGAGGYTREILREANCTVYAIDRDPNVKTTADALSQEFSGRFIFLAGTFGSMLELLQAQGVERVDGIVLDIGVSSMQIDQPERGFSFRHDGPLDMRMGQVGLSAEDIVNEASEASLADIIFHYGEDRAARRIAKAIVEARNTARIETTSQLAKIVASVVGRGKAGIDPATRTFQALRIHVNDELGELSRALDAAEHLLAPGGRLVVVTFHSLEDGMVKRFFRSRTGEAKGVSRYVPAQVVRDLPLQSFTQPVRKAVLASDEETRINTRARSAKLRWAVRTDAPALPQSFAELEAGHAAF